VILVDSELRKLGPTLLDPYEVKNVQPASIDLRLGQSFRVFKRHSRASIDLAAVPDQDSITEEIIVPWYRNPDGTSGDERGGMVVHPGEMILGSTLECITVPGYLAMQLVGKSSLARLGLLPHVEAGWFDPGWHGIGTLEIANLGATPIILRPGMLICQSRWMHVDGEPEHLYGSANLGSHYQDAKGAEGSKYEG
jgi:dCTP deaminase